MTNQNGSTALAKAEPDDVGLIMHCSPAEAERRLQELQAFVKKAMVQGLDYGTIPGTEKPTLYQPGAQKLCELYGLAHDFLDTEAIQDWERGFFMFRKRCVITLRRNGTFVGAGVGSCNSREDRYAWRWLPDKKLPKSVNRDALESKEGKWGTLYRMANPDVYSLVNTIEKMACKRALVHAVISVTRSAGIFTQDVEDLPAEAFGEPDQRRSWEQAKVVDAEVVEEETDEERLAKWGARFAAARTKEEVVALRKEFEKAPHSNALKLSVDKHYEDAKKRIKAAGAPPREREIGEEG